jgi:hypothetical protein
MTDTTLDSPLRAAAITTFEQMVFVLPDSPPDAVQRAKPVRAVARVTFSGPATGVLQVSACEGLLPSLTAKLLGQHIDSQAVQLDALGEIANIICGQIFMHLDPDNAFLQEPPAVEVCTSPPGVDWPEASARVELGLDGSRAEIALYLFNGAAEAVTT